MSKSLSTVLGSVAFVALTTGALACEGQPVLYEDDFSFADPAWGNYADVRIANGVLSLVPAENGSSVLENQSGFFEGNLDVCVDLVQNVSDPSVAWGGLLFGGVDYNNYYLLQVATNGFVNVARLQKGRWIYPVSWLETQGAVQPGATVNQVRIITNGNQVTGYVNGQQVLQFRAQLPDGGSLLGFYGTSTKGTATFDFDNFKVTQASDQPPAAVPTPPPGNGGGGAELEPDEPDVPADEPPAGGAPKPGQPGAPKIPG